MEFNKYQSLCRLGTTEVNGILDGKCYIFPKLDGTNASVWKDITGITRAGSRNRTLELGERDNRGFYGYVSEHAGINLLLHHYPALRVFGEWLVQHSFKNYRKEALNKFYVFDVVEDNPDGSYRYWTYEEYQPLLEEYQIDYIPPIKILSFPSEDDIIFQAKYNNKFLVEDGKGVGEGVVVKRYGYVNKYGRVTWAKFVTSEFKEVHTKTMGAPEVEFVPVERKIVDKYVTKALCEKIQAKIENDMGDWSSKYIPRLLNTVYYDLVREDCWNFIKEHKNPTIDFKRLLNCTISKVKEHLPMVF